MKEVFVIYLDFENNSNDVIFYNTKALKFENTKGFMFKDYGYLLDKSNFKFNNNEVYIFRLGFPIQIHDKTINRIIKKELKKCYKNVK